MTQIYIANLGKYNEGELVGEWFDFPIDMNEVATQIGLNARYEEIAIHDYETVYPISISEYENIETLNKKIEALDSIDGLRDLCESLNGDAKYSVDSWAGDLMCVLDEMEYSHDIVSDDWVEEYVKNSDRGWQGIRIFLHGASVHNEYHLLDGYGNLEELRYEDAKNMLKEAIEQYLD